ncbi:MAG: hydrogenase nickel incorporation protein HypB [Nitrospinota bacterium]
MASKIIEIKKNILHKNEQLAASNREFFHNKNLTVLNFTSSPGSGKTTLLVDTLQRLDGKFKSAVLEGDQHTDNDAKRIAKTGVDVVQINTLSICHLDASMISKALDEIEIDGLDFLFIENVGNLVCPASYDLGELMKVVVISTTEGEDKPEKYPKMFLEAKVVILTKIDLLPYLDFDLDRFLDSAFGVNPNLKLFKVSAKTGAGLDEWMQWLTTLRTS